MSEWQKDWARYEPATELNRVDKLIMRGSADLPAVYQDFAGKSNSIDLCREVKSL
jgi:hypothetical protein